MEQHRTEQLQIFSARSNRSKVNWVRWRPCSMQLAMQKIATGRNQRGMGNTMIWSGLSSHKCNLGNNYMRYIASIIKEGKRMSNPLYGVCNAPLICVRRAVQLSALCTWQHLIFLGTKKNRSSSWMLGLYPDLLAFSVAITPVLAALETMPTIISLNQALLLVSVWIPGTWLSENISHRPYI